MKQVDLSFFKSTRNWGFLPRELQLLLCIEEIHYRFQVENLIQLIQVLLFTFHLITYTSCHVIVSRILKWNELDMLRFLSMGNQEIVIRAFRIATFLKGMTADNFTPHNTILFP